jgi:hypothetical protein
MKTDQPELDLPLTSSAQNPTPKPRLGGFGGYSRGQLLCGLLVVIAIVWAVWVTKTVTAKREHIVSVRLADVVGDYVEMQRYSVSPPEQVRAEMQQFMQALDKELQARSGKGQIVLVGEAVLSKDVEDITNSVKKAVFTSGIAMPKRASAADLQLMQQAAAAPVPQSAPTAPTVPTVSVQSAPQATEHPGFGAPAQPGGPVPPAPAATVSTFGGPNGNGVQ